MRMIKTGWFSFHKNFVPLYTHTTFWWFFLVSLFYHNLCLFKAWVLERIYRETHFRNPFYSFNVPTPVTTYDCREYSQCSFRIPQINITFTSKPTWVLLDWVVFLCDCFCCYFSLVGFCQAVLEQQQRHLL